MGLIWAQNLRGGQELGLQFCMHAIGLRARLIATPAVHTTRMKQPIWIKDTCTQNMQK